MVLEGGVGFGKPRRQLWDSEGEPSRGLFGVEDVMPVTVTGAAVIDHIGRPGDPYRVTVIRLGRKAETYELRWRETVRDEGGGPPVRERRAAPGGYIKAEAYTRAEKVNRALEHSDGRQGAPPQPKTTTRTR